MSALDAEHHRVLRDFAEADRGIETIDELIAAGDTGDTGEKPKNKGLEPSPVTGSKAGKPGKGFRLTEAGVFSESDDGEPVWICSRLGVIAKTRNSDGEAWGRLLEWHDPDGRKHRWACPADMLAGDGLAFRSVLMDAGLEIAPGVKARQALQTYVQTYRTEARAICTDQTGWHDGVFVLPDEAIGTHSDEILLQTAGEPPRLRQQGTVEQWREQIAALCVGNSRLVMAVSAAFAAPLVHITGQESGGLHIVGASSTGKTTALRVAASVWGGPEYLKRWRATGNGLESIAAAHNDGLLILDELAQVESREAGSIAYMLANGTGKHRAKRDGIARPAMTWRLLFLSAGEIGLADHMAEAGKRARAGQEVRLCDVPADTGVHGLFEDLHGYPSGAALSEHLNQVAGQVYGVPIRQFLTALAGISDADISARFRALCEQFVVDHVPDDAQGQPRRVAGRFALVAAGGELATAMRLTCWPEGEATRAAGVCYQAWLDRRGGSGSQEEAEALAAVRHFIELHGESRFASIGDSQSPVHNRAGFRRFCDGETQYLILPEVFRRDICKGHDYRRVARMLRDRGLLVTEASDRLTIKPSVGRCYAIREGIADA